MINRFSAAFGLAVVLCFAASAGPALGQGVPKQAEAKISAGIRSSAAYAELLLKRTELQAELESLAMEYTDEFPKVAEARYAIEAVERERAWLLALRPADPSRLTVALGKLLVRKAEAEVELWSLRRSFQDAHPEVKRARRKVEIFEVAIKDTVG